MSDQKTPTTQGRTRSRMKYMVCAHTTSLFPAPARSWVADVCFVRSLGSRMASGLAPAASLLQSASVVFFCDSCFLEPSRKICTLSTPFWSATGSSTPATRVSRSGTPPWWWTGCGPGSPSGTPAAGTTMCCGTPGTAALRGRPSCDRTSMGLRVRLAYKRPVHCVHLFVCMPGLPKKRVLTNKLWWNPKSL